MPWEQREKNQGASFGAKDGLTNRIIFEHEDNIQSVPSWAVMEDNTNAVTCITAIRIIFRSSAGCQWQQLPVKAKRRPGGLRILKMLLSARAATWNKTQIKMHLDPKRNCFIRAVR